MHLNEDLCTCYCMMIIIFYVTIITVAKCTTKVATMDTGTSPNMDTTPNVRTPDMDTTPKVDTPKVVNRAATTNHTLLLNLTEQG